MTSFTTTAETIVDLPREQAFFGVMQIELSTIFTGYGPLPAVIGKTNQVGGWDAVGQTRTVLLSDRSSANEKITEYCMPEHFGYTLSDFTGIFRLITSYANGEWWFESVSEGKTHIKWSYTYNSHNLLTIPLLWFIVKVLWRGYMGKSLALTKQEIETNCA